MRAKDLIEGTFRAPAETYRQVAALGLSRGTLLEILVLTVVLSVILTTFELMVLGGELPPEFIIMEKPLVFACVQVLLNVIFIVILHRVLRMAGGQNQPDQIVLAVVWVQAVLLASTAIQLVLILVIPVLAVLIGFGGLIYSAYLIGVFANEAAGFRSLARGIALALVALFVSAFVTAFLMMLTGVVDPAELTHV